MTDAERHAAPEIAPTAPSNGIKQEKKERIRNWQINI
jgi:hypothetical protein